MPTQPPEMCPYGDPLCPCPDGLLCHYEGDGAWDPPGHGTYVLGDAADKGTEVIVLRPVLRDSLSRFKPQGWD